MQSESEESESEESEDSSSEDSDVEFVLKPAEKKAGKAMAKEKAPKAPKKSSILSEVEALKAEIAALKKEKNSSKAAPVNVFFNQKGGEKKKMSAMEVKDMSLRSKRVGLWPCKPPI